jgi:H+-transporting ATPase
VLTPRYSIFSPTSENLSCTEFVDRQLKEISTRGIRSLAIARQDNEDGRWRLLGILTFLDPPRPDTRITIEQARCFGLEVRH